MIHLSLKTKLPIVFSCLFSSTHYLFIKLVKAILFISIPLVIKSQSINISSVHNPTNYIESWVLELDDEWVQAPLLAEDLDRDGNYEIALQGFYEGMAALVSKNGNYVNGWPKFIGDGNASPVSGNLDDDKELEVIFTSNLNGIHAFNYDGTYVDGWPVELYVNNSRYDSTKVGLWSSPTLYDIDQDGKVELIVSGFLSNTVSDSVSNEVFIIDDNGEKINLKNKLKIKNQSFTSAAVGDIDNNNIADIITVDHFGIIYAWDIDGDILEGWPSYVFADSTSRYISPVLGDLNSDGYLEIIVTKSSIDFGAITVLDYRGNTLPGWPKSTNSILESPAISDMDNDGSADIILNCDYPYGLYVFNYKAEPINRFTKDAGSMHSPLITDLDGDKKPDIIAVAKKIGARNFELFAWNNSGEVIQGFPITTGTTGGTPVLGDFDSDGLVEIALATWNTDNDPATLLYYDLDRSYSRKYTTWPTYRHDNGRTGLSDTSLIHTKIEQNSEYKFSDFAVSNFPNPFNNSTNININIPEKDEYSIEVYDIIGDKIATLYNGSLIPGFQKFRFDAFNLSSGIYILRVVSNKYSVANKLMIIK